ncbi:xanthine dehydrogenase family protein molybdopterin-binding subunit [Sneathiella marina]|uniref:Xanthine dehydrogenase family protein molybdopterin-binding subunit n=1 Tax=Sneathiella marina TaxID=2950108 RepID=A0ABY4W7A2_9PROT|nr:xanthine dehydrogenase family protein molybdopterin-binding subunit [Sneathiella marina]USG63060.1 xanthine dehydrogenase family protein molybdopterin-binding subunit [Sneathiella marina]
MAKFGLTRRKFLVAGALVGGGLAIGYGFKSDKPDNAALSASTSEGEIALNAWIKIDSKGVVTVAIPRSEMGQGIYTALAMLVAEELDADFETIKVEQAPIDDVYANVSILQDALPFSDKFHDGEDTIGATGMAKVAGLLGVQVTGGSTSVRDAWGPMRQAGATARSMLVMAAARTWNVSPDECTVEKGVISHLKTNQSGNFGDFVVKAASETVPLSDTLKKPDDFEIIGKSKNRLDIPEKVTGKAVFGIDIALPDMAFAAVKLSPVFGGKLSSHDEKTVLEMPGVLKVVPFETGVAVVADSFWRAKTAVEKISATFDSGEAASTSSDQVIKTLTDNLSSDDARIYAEVGDAPSVLSSAPNKVTASYTVPYLAHACLEPMNCTAKVTETGVEVWMPNQAPTLIKWFAEKIADVPAENVKVHTTLLGGGFGRRAEIDLVLMAVTIAKSLKNRPIKLVWTRENDMQHDMYRPAAVSEFQASLGADGKIEAWKNRIVSQSVSGSFTARLIPWATMDAPDNTTSEGAADIPYEFSNRLVDHVPVKFPIPVGFWRSVGHSYNGFFTESFMDEAAFAANQDPVEFRLAHLGEHRDFATILQKAKEISNWSSPLPAGKGRGIALHESFGSIVAQVAEVSVSEDKTVTVDKVFCVIDCGTVVNPDTVIAQMEGGIIFGLSATLFGEITIENGQVVNENFPDYDMVRLANSPVIETVLAPSGRRLGGVGEPGTPPIAPAVTNAIFAATGDRIRELPITKSGYSA